MAGVSACEFRLSRSQIINCTAFEAGAIHLDGGVTDLYLCIVASCQAHISGGKTANPRTLRLNVNVLHAISSYHCHLLCHHCHLRRRPCGSRWLGSFEQMCSDGLCIQHGWWFPGCSSYIISARLSISGCSCVLIYWTIHLSLLSNIFCVFL